MSQFSEEQIQVAVKKLNAHHRHTEIHYDDTLFKIELATGLSESEVLDLVMDPEVERQTHA